MFAMQQISSASVPPQGPPKPTWLLPQLKAAHEALAQAMQQVDQLAKGQVPSREALAKARHLISRASFRRRAVSQSIYEELLPLASPTERALLNDLIARDARLLQESTYHVATWSLDAALGCWEGYCDASARLRWKMKAAMQYERLTLFRVFNS